MRKDLKLHGSLGVGYFSQYIGWPSCANYDDSVFQQSINVTVEQLGLYVKGWSSVSLNGFNDNYGTEIDYITGIYRTVGKVEIDVSYVFYNMYNINNTKGDLHALILHLDLPKIFSVK
ncbi:MAG: hypothetical protein U9O55_01265 [Patescibacteria group bacterium]|nr:hypothetical protein [Patescibacteria group bacterium]